MAFHFHINNKSAIKLIKNVKILNELKHINVKYYVVKKAYHAKIFNLSHVPLTKNITDTLTKASLKPTYVN